MKTKIIALGTLFALAAHADPYQELDKVNQRLRDRIQTRSAQLSAGGISPEQTALLQQQNAADQQVLDNNQGTSRAVRAKDRGVSDSFVNTLLLANQANANAAAATKKSSGSSSSSGGDSKPATPNPNFQVQKLDVPEAKFDTSVPADSPLLSDLQEKIKSLGKVLEEPVDTKQLSISASIDKEIADLNAASETRITLLRAAAAFNAAAQKERDAKKDTTKTKTFADELSELEKNTSGKSTGFDKAVDALSSTVVPPPKASSFKNQDMKPINSGGHVDTLSNQTQTYDPKVISARDKPAN